MNKLSKSQELYNNLAPFYEEYAKEKFRYLQAVDRIILQEAGEYSSMLDAGCGNGKRGYNLAQKLKVKDLYLVDNSEMMIKNCQKYKKEGANPRLFDISKQDLTDLGIKFEIIICLSNVIAHIDDKLGRKNALINLKNALGKDGIIYLDVNNRYNMGAYGKINVLRNILKDLVMPNKNNGYFNFYMNAGGKKIPASVYLFNPFEIEKIIKKTGLKILKKYYLNYKTGELKKSFWEGQILFKLTQ